MPMLAWMWKHRTPTWSATRRGQHASAIPNKHLPLTLAMTLILLRRAFTLLDSETWVSGIRSASTSSLKSKSTKRQSSSPPNNAPQPSKQPAECTELDAFFAKYPTFDYDPSAPVTVELRRMCKFFQWPKKKRREPKLDKHEERLAAEEGFRKALVGQFNSLFGKKVDKLQNWQRLCQLLQIDPIPIGLEACRKAVKNTHVNLIDLVDYTRTGTPARIHPSEERLRDYTKAEGKYFPKERAHAGGVLRYLLRRIHVDVD
ncbi:hypothetical protein SCP_0114830 [Sparassis crispa]|uniref:Uncharacterized protein n=1 Tax=Sparassis crispa TaxID=139825 RepID=A0A401G8U6_9APHY|nr:hypothetical protein SCP_0114830 [Sparassis crispa]GBE78594.1 hypothetical protein SCP_0114830 [Sparassis crispa]